MKLNNKNSKVAVNESFEKRTQDVINAYRKYANLTEDAKIVEIDEWALNEAATWNRYPVETLREQLLKEETIEQAAKNLDAEVATGSQSQIHKVLDKSLKKALRMKGATEDFPNVLLIGDAGSSKAQPLTSKVYTPNGYKLMGDIKIGDIVLDGKGNATKVSGVYPQGIRDIYKLNLSDGTFIEVADNHLNSVYRIWPKSNPKKQGREDLVLTTLELKNIIEADGKDVYGRQYSPIMFIEPVSIKAWKSESLPINPYLLGCLIGDGSINNNALCFSSMDKEIIDTLDGILRRDHDCYLSHEKYCAPCDYYIKNASHDWVCNRDSGTANLRRLLRSFNLNVTAAYKHIPDCYLYASFEDRLALLQGLMDTDGSCATGIVSKFTGKQRSGGVGFASISKQLVEDVAFLARSLGCVVKVKDNRENPTYTYKYKGTVETRSCAQSFSAYIQAPENLPIFRLTRKLANIREQRFEPRRKVVSVEFDRKDYCQCIYVESDEHTYITDNLTLTHNTSAVRQWAKENNINLVQKNLGTMGPEAFGGIIARDADDPRYATRLGTNEMIKALSKPRSVLFLDEYNRAKTEVRGAVLTLVQNHMVWDPTEDDQEKYLDNFLFTVAAINPPNGAYKGAKELDPAELSRFYSMNIDMNPTEHLAYLKKEYSKEIAKEDDAEAKLELEGRLAIAEKLLSDPDFYYDTSAEVQDNYDDNSYRPLNYRSLKMALDFSDGTKKDFLDIWSHYCNYKKKGIVETILSDYVDVKDKANDAIKDGSESDVFARSKTNREKLKAKFANLNV